MKESYIQYKDYGHRSMTKNLADEAIKIARELNLGAYINLPSYHNQNVIFNWRNNDPDLVAEFWSRFNNRYRNK